MSLKRRSRGVRLSALPLFLWLGVGSGCATQTSTTVRDYDDQGRPGSTYSVQASLVGKQKARIDQAQALVREGDYAGGIALLEEMHREPNLEDSWRQEVLILLGEVHGMPLNPRRDPEKAASYLEEMLAQYPESEHAERARELLETYGVSRDD